LYIAKVNLHITHKDIINMDKTVHYHFYKRRMEGPLGYEDRNY